MIESEIPSERSELLSPSDISILQFPKRVYVTKVVMDIFGILSLITTISLCIYAGAPPFVIISTIAFVAPLFFWDLWKNARKWSAIHADLNSGRKVQVTGVVTEAEEILGNINDRDEIYSIRLNGQKYEVRDATATICMVGDEISAWSASRSRILISVEFIHKAPRFKAKTAGDDIDEIFREI